MVHFLAVLTRHWCGFCSPWNHSLSCCGETTNGSLSNWLWSPFWQLYWPSSYTLHQVNNYTMRQLLKRYSGLLFRVHGEKDHGSLKMEIKMQLEILLNNLMSKFTYLQHLKHLYNDYFACDACEWCESILVKCSHELVSFLRLPLSRGHSVGWCFPLPVVELAVQKIATHSLPKTKIQYKTPVENQPPSFPYQSSESKTCQSTHGSKSNLYSKSATLLTHL